MTACPTREQLEQLLADQLPTAEAGPLEAHVASCRVCMHVLEELTSETAVLRGWGSFPRSVPQAKPRWLDPTRLNKPPLPPAAAANAPHATRLRLLEPPLPGAGTQLPRVPGYEVLGDLGQGGMGVVYKARHLDLDRIVALKMLLAGPQAQEADQARFRSEAEAVARLRHPNVVQIYEIGVVEGRPYFAMEYVEGGSLGDGLNGLPQPAGAAAALVETLARAIHEAHGVGIVHRDLKPANILLQKKPGARSQESEGRKQRDRFSSDSWLLTPDSCPKITDFGLAKRLDREGLTRTGLVMGTPAYMAPEQAAADNRQVGPATDLYSLGVILYELLTGRRPLQGTSDLETVLLVLHEEPVPPRRLQPKLPRDLETICLKCLRKDPARRYATALDLAEDLRRFQAGEPVHARPVGAPERAWRWARRRPAAAALALVVALVALVGFPGVTLLWLAAVEARTEASGKAEAASAANALAQEQKRQADELRQQAERREARLALDRGLALCEEGQTDQGLLWLTRSLELASRAGEEDLQAPIRAGLADWSGQLCLPGPVFRHQPEITAVAFHPKGKVALTAATAALASGLGTAVLQWDVTTGQEGGRPLTVPFKWNHLWAVACSPDGQLALVGRADGTAQFFATSTGRPGHLLVHEEGKDTCVWAVAFSPDGQTAVTGGSGPLGQPAAGGQEVMEGIAHFWKVSTGERLPLVLRHREPVSAVTFRRDGKAVLTGSWDGTAQIWSADTGKPLAPTLLHRDRVKAVAFSPDGRTVLTGCRDGAARLWDAASGSVLGAPLQHVDEVQAVAFSPDGRTLLTGSRDGTARLWSATGRPLGPALTHDGGVSAVAFRPDGGAFLLGGFKGSARLWRLPPARALGPPLQHARAVHTVAFSRDGRTVLTASEGDARLWTGAADRILVQSTARKLVRALAYDPHGQVAALGTWTGGPTLWKVAAADGPPPEPLPLALPLDHAEDAVNLLAFNHDGRQLLMVGANRDRQVRAWDVHAGRLLPLSLDHPARVWCLAVSPDGKLLATGCEDGAARLWDLAAGRLVGRPLEHPDAVKAAAVSPDGRLLLTGCQDGTARLWEIATGRQLATAPQHRGMVLAVAFSPDGRLLLTGSGDRTARLWDARTGAPVGQPLGHQDAVQAVAFSPDGRLLLTGSRDRTAQLWQAPGLVQGEPERLRLWVETLTGLELDPHGGVHRLDPGALHERRAALDALGGPPQGPRGDQP